MESALNVNELVPITREVGSSRVGPPLTCPSSIFFFFSCSASTTKPIQPSPHLKSFKRFEIKSKKHPSR